MDFSASMDKIDLISEMRRLGLQPRIDEQVYAIIPKHVSKVYLPTLASIALTLLFIMILGVLASSSLGTPGIYGGATVFIGLIYLSVLAYTISQWIGYKQSALIFTNQRIINADYRTIFTRLVPEVDIFMVKNSRSATKGGLQKLFNYGDLMIERYGDLPLIVHDLPYPQLAAEQTMHFHNLAAHGGVSSVHNFSATSITEDNTPELKEHQENERQEEVVQLANGIATPLVATRTAAQSVSLTNSKEELGGISLASSKEGQGDWQGDGQRDGQGPKQPVNHLNFEATGNTIGKVLQNLKTENEPTVTYLANRDTFEIEATVLEDEAEQTAYQLKVRGASRIRTGR